jgi:hypothetical protein
VGDFTIHPDARIDLAESRVLEIVFSLYDPQHVGIIDYHGPSRNYTREQIGGVNLDIEAAEQQLSQHALYNYANKYTNLKTEMASTYIRQILAQQAGVAQDDGTPLIDTLKELFRTFFPGKAFLGPQPTADGLLTFPVRTPSGSIHDINELSSGEKEVLYGYLRLRSSAPRNSVLLIDEPELHLNPRLVSGLAGFYQKHLSRPLGNQLWLVTHSDTLIREAVSGDGFKVYHMQPPGMGAGANQASIVQANEDIERVVIDLVGDLAAYRPGAKIVIFEGGGNTEFDVRMTCTLFPEFQGAVNTISAGNKRQVRRLHELLEAASTAASLGARFFSVTDRDAEAGSVGSPRGRFQWDVYHIENYLLDANAILQVLIDLNLNVVPVDTEAGVEAELAAHAKDTITALVRHQLELRTNQRMVACLNARVDTSATHVAPLMAQAARRSADKLNSVLTGDLSAEDLERVEKDLRMQAAGAMTDGTWRAAFRGREILRGFVRQHARGVNYEMFRDLVLARMRDAGCRPPGMDAVVRKILES